MGETFGIMGGMSDPAPDRRAARRRRIPVQGRSRRTVAGILDAAAAILAESGPPALNTNAIAGRAGVNVATLYAYFPDKNAVLHELAERFEAKRVGYVERRLIDLVTAADWRRVHDQIIDRMVQFRLKEPAGVELRRALISEPELRHLDEESTARSADALARALHTRCPEMGEQRAALVGRVVAETVTQLLDASFRGDTHDAPLIEELKSMTDAYVSRYLD